MSTAPTVTDILNIFDVDNQITNIKGSFRYRYFDSIEQIDEFNRFANDPVKYPKGTPRYVHLEWVSKNKKLTEIGLSPETVLIHKQNLFFASDLSPTYCVLTVAEKEMLQRQSHAISDNATTGSKLDYLLKTVSSNEYTEDIENNLDVAGDSSKIPVVAPVTNRPVQSVSVTDQIQTPDIQIRAMNIDQVIKSSNNSPLSRDVYRPVQEKAEVLYKKRSSAPSPNVRRLTTLFHTISQLRQGGDSKFPSISRNGKPNDYLRNWEPIGFVVSKYRVKNGSESYMYSRVVADISFDDPYVAYGQTYRYQLRPVYAKYVFEEGDDTVVFLGSEESAFIDIECKEDRVPSPPRNPKFEYALNSNIRVSWERPQSYVLDGGLIDTDDIKGYQLFVRNSLYAPYQLYRYFTFNTTKPESMRMRSLETISDDYIISSEYTLPDNIDPDEIPSFYEYTEYVVPIRANVDYYFALCSVDAHGNSSNYSAQYKIRRNNVTGEVDIQLICPVGAPKQYPNLLVPGKLVQPAMKVSGYQFMDTYFCPDSQLSVPNLEGESVNIQLFELETQVEKNITITMKQMPFSTN